MSGKAAFFHTTTATVLPMRDAFFERFPDAELITMVDDSILPEVIANDNMPTPGILRRLITYAAVAEEQGAGVFVCMCTTLGMAIREAQKAVNIPMISIDGPMLRQAVSEGKRIALLITFAPTEKVSGETARAFARDCGRDDVEVDVVLVEGARDALNAGDAAKHDDLIVEKACRLRDEYDTIVFAQVSMANAAGRCREMGMQVLSGVESGIEQIEKYL